MIHLNSFFLTKMLNYHLQSTLLFFLNHLQNTSGQKLVEIIPLFILNFWSPLCELNDFLCSFFKMIHLNSVFLTKTIYSHLQSTLFCFPNHLQNSFGPKLVKIVSTQLLIMKVWSMQLKFVSAQLSTLILDLNYSNSRATARLFNISNRFGWIAMFPTYSKFLHCLSG